MLTLPECLVLEDIERFCRQHQLDYIDGITTFCEQNSIEIEVIAELIKNDPAFFNVHLAAVMADIVMIPVGTLDNASAVKPAMQIYCDSAQSWAVLEGGIQRFPKMPMPG